MKKKKVSLESVEAVIQSFVGNKRSQRGITLIALIVTIIILLILAGITIMYTVGDNGILKAAKEAKNKTDAAISNEQQSLGDLKNIIKEEYGNSEGEGNNSESGGNTENPDNPNPDIPTGPTIDDSTSSNHTATTIDYTWKQIDKIAQAIANSSNVTNETTEVTANIDGTTCKIGVGDIATVTWDGTSKRVRVLGFKHDDLVNTATYGGSHSKASISFEFLDCIGELKMNGISSVDSTNVNGWAETDMRKYLERAGEVGQLSNNSYIKQVKKKYIATYNNASSVTTCNDYLWLLSASEVMKDGYNGGDTRGRTITKEGEQYLYYKNNATEKWNYASENRIKYDNGSAKTWWLRSPYYANSTHFCLVSANGNCDVYLYSANPYGMAPGFCI